MMVNNDKRTEKVLRKDGFSFILIKFELLVAHSCFYDVGT